MKSSHHPLPYTQNHGWAVVPTITLGQQSDGVSTHTRPWNQNQREQHPQYLFHPTQAIREGEQNMLAVPATAPRMSRRQSDRIAVSSPRMTAKHTQRRHKQAAAGPKLPCPFPSCPSMADGFAPGAGMRDHFKTHTRPWGCRGSGKTFSTSHKYKTHLQNCAYTPTDQEVRLNGYRSEDIRALDKGRVANASTIEDYVRIVDIVLKDRHTYGMAMHTDDAGWASDQPGYQPILDNFDVAIGEMGWGQVADFPDDNSKVEYSYDGLAKLVNACNSSFSGNSPYNHVG